MPGVNQASGGCNCPGAGVTCVTCSGTIPDALSITDANGTYTATWNSPLSLWITPQLCASSQNPVATCANGNNACQFNSQSGQPLYVYGIECFSPGKMTIYRYWYELQCVSPSYQYATCGCIVGSGMHVYSSSGPVEVTCGSIAWSGTLTKIVGNLSDPVVGTTSLTQ
jgi:hypothetical protein